ncbi:hypothetical protein [Cytophaga aurantiaca]|uniref:hypothetical protein n=1 Tax=Cytophaga aurantiaca TaxID=29530 RepID=UPI00035DD12C|nr:hypothetical protein [Cytophaga aurantiaca]
MGFNIGVHSDEAQVNDDCYFFIEREFHTFVCSYDNFGEISVLKKAGEYYNIDLTPLTKLVYTNDEVAQEYIDENTQDTVFLLNVAQAFFNKIEEDRNVCEKISYKAYDEIMDFPDEVKETFINQMGVAMANEIFQQLEEDKKEQEENPNPWNDYFKSGRILEHLRNLIKRIECYKNKGISKIYLTAG